MTEFLQITLSGLATGAIYALVAVGFSLLWQASQTINFGQGEFAMVPAFLTLGGMQLLGLPLWLAVIVALIITVLLLGVVFKLAIVDPILPHGVLPLVIATVALGTLLRESTKGIFGAQAQPFPSLLPENTIELFGVAISLHDLANLLISLLVVAGLQLFLDRTRTGRAMQATAQNRQVAEILGVNVRRMILYTFALNALLAGIASLLISPIYLAKFSNGESLGLVAFTAAIVGGFNQIRGALVGGLLVGVIDNWSATYISVEYRAAFPLLLLIVIILLRPQGLLGKAEGRVI